MCSQEFCVGKFYVSLSSEKSSRNYLSDELVYITYIKFLKDFLDALELRLQLRLCHNIVTSIDSQYIGGW